MSALPSFYVTIAAPDRDAGPKRYLVEATDEKHAIVEAVNLFFGEYPRVGARDRLEVWAQPA